MKNYTSERPEPDHVFEERQARLRQQEESSENRERFSEWHREKVWHYPVFLFDDIGEYAFGYVNKTGIDPVYKENICRIWRRTRDNNYMLFWECIPARLNLEK